MPEPSLDDVRYKRHVLLPGVGAAGQRELQRAKVLLVGLGGLGSPVALYLAAAGVGTLGLVDEDVVDVSNLQRQILYTESDVGRRKAQAAQERLGLLNPQVATDVFPQRFCAENAARLVAGYDFVVDCVDSFASKYLINDSCVRAGIPFCTAGVLEYVGQILTVLPGRTACYRCAMGEVDTDTAPKSENFGILGPLAGLFGTLQAIEVIKYITKCGENLTNRMLCCDVQGMDFYTRPVARDPNCRLCGAMSA